ncbi:SIS domain-containing protein [Streptomyces lydicus]|nr:SIS domain-containing protein [Streptomyces lydicus]
MPGEALRRVVLVGSGDSHHAGRAAQLAFLRLTGLPCEALGTQQFLDYGMLGPASPHAATLVVAVSASGSSPRLVTTVRRARAHGFRPWPSPAARAAPSARRRDGRWRPRSA